MKTKIKSHGNKGKDFYSKETSKLESNHTCLAVIILDSALKKNDNHCHQMFLKECKYIEKNVVRYIHDSLSDFTSDDEENIKAIRLIFVRVISKESNTSFTTF